LRFLDQAFIQDLTERKLVEVALREMPNYGELAGCPACLLNIAKRSLPKLILSGVGLASNDAWGEFLFRCASRAARSVGSCL
jgi:hypothetical protein